MLCQEERDINIVGQTLSNPDTTESILLPRTVLRQEQAIQQLLNIKAIKQLFLDCVSINVGRVEKITLGHA